jgi:hypothetical protein
LQRINSPHTLEVTGALSKVGQQTSRTKYVLPLEVRGKDVGKDSTHYITAWAVEKIQQSAEAKAPWQLRNRFPGYKLEKQHLDQLDHEIDLLIGQDNHAIFPTDVTSRAIEGGELRLMRTIFGYPYLF